MDGTSLTINNNLLKKIGLVAKKSGKSVEDCVVIALQDYVENYEDTRKTDLCMVENMERSFFLSVGK